MYKGTALFITALLLFTGCELWRIDEVAADKPTWALPLAYGSFGLQEMVQQNPHIKEILIVDDVLTLVYRGDDLVIRGRDYLPALSTDLPLLMTDTIARFVVPPLQGFTIFEGTLKGSTAVFAAVSPFSQDINMTFRSNELRVGTQPWATTFQLDYQGSLPVSFTSPELSLDGIILAPSNQQITFNYSALGTEANLGKLSLATITIKKVAFSLVRGFTARGLIGGGPQVIPIDFYRDFEGGDISLTAPKITLHVTNTFGIPVAAEVSNIYAASPSVPRFNITSTLLAAPLTFAYPEQPEDGVMVTDLEINTSNANLVETFAIQPENIFFEVNFIMNPDNIKELFWLADSSYLRIESQIQVPLQGHVDYFQVRDTIPLNLVDFPANSQLFIHGTTDNELPLGGQFNVEFLHVDGTTTGLIWPEFQQVAVQTDDYTFDLLMPVTNDVLKRAVGMVVHIRFDHDGKENFAINASQKFTYQLGLRYTTP